MNDPTSHSWGKGTRRISNILICVAIVWLINWIPTNFHGQPIVYCTLIDTPFVRQIASLHRLGLIALVLLFAGKVAARDRDAGTTLIFVLLYAGFPSFCETLFNLPPGCQS